MENVEQRAFISNNDLQKIRITSKKDHTIMHRCICAKYGREEECRKKPKITANILRQ